MKFLIAGYGSIGRRHFRNLLALGQKDIIFLRSQKSTLSLEELEGFSVETDLAAALAQRPDAVIIANPTALHLDVAIPAAKQGCHILFEKPISDSMDGIQQLEAALAAGGGQAMTGFQFRFHPGLRKVKELLVENAIGKVISARAEWGEYLPSWHPWEDYRSSYAARKDLGGGVVRTLSHPLDYLHWLIGDVKLVAAFTHKVASLDIEVEGLAEIGLQFRNGSLASLHLDYIQTPGVHQLKIIGETGTLVWDNSNGAVEFFKVGQTAWQQFLPPEGFERNDLFMSEMRHFIDVIRNRATPICSLSDGIYAQKVVDAVYLSSEQERFVAI